MPTISIHKEALFAALGRKVDGNSDAWFDELCFKYGLELDEVATEKQIALKEHEDLKNATEQVVYKIEIPANRYDLLCLEGVAQILKIYLDKDPYDTNRKQDSEITQPPEYKLLPVKERILVTRNVAQIRPYAVGAVLRNIKFTPASYASFIDLQDKLHQNLCRKRVLVSMGTHDLDTIKGPFTYDALPPDQINFRPLNQTKSYSAGQLMDLYSSDSHLKHFLHIIRDSSVYPVFTDSNGVVLSLPPIINGDHSKITLNTRNVFIEITATDLTKAVVVLDVLVTMFSVHCDPKFTIEQVEVQDPHLGTRVYPSLKSRTMLVSVEQINRLVGIHEEAPKIRELLERMSLGAEVINSGKQLKVTIPPTRHDILHPCDLVEDVAIAYEFNRIEKRMPDSVTIGDQFIINRVSDLLRKEVVAAGYTEALTFALCSREDIADKLRHKIETRLAVHIANPKTLEFQVARTSLIPGLLKTVAGNKKMPLPIKLFEISDIVVKDASYEVGARNIRHFCAVYYGKTSGFEIVHGLLDRFMQLLGIPPSADVAGYRIEPYSDPTFFDGRCAQITALGKPVGVFGVLHPEVLQNFELTNPCSIMEINIEPFI